MNILVNGKLVKETDNIVSAEESSFNYGFGLFETVKLADGKLFFFKEHYNRLYSSCKVLEIDFDLDYRNLCCQIDMLLNDSGLKDGRIKIVYTKDKKLIISAAYNVYTPDRYCKGFKLCFAESLKNPHSKLTYLKSMNYLENLTEKNTAQKKGFDEAVFFNINGHLTEGSYTNIFFVKKGTVYTPEISCGLLAGILRSKVIDLLHNLNIKLVLGCFNKEDLFNAEEIFLTNSLMEIMPVCKLEEKKFSIYPDCITEWVSKEFSKLYH